MSGGIAGRRPLSPRLRRTLNMLAIGCSLTAGAAVALAVGPLFGWIPGPTVALAFTTLIGLVLMVIAAEFGGLALIESRRPFE